MTIPEIFQKNNIYTVNELAAKLGAPIITIKRRCQKGKYNCFKIANTWLIIYPV